MSGVGRMLEPMDVLGHIRIALGKNGRLAGKKVVVTAGGTQEAIDPVRVITNHSSGKQGYALAQAALDAGADVTLITTPTALTPPVGAKVINVKSVQDMLDALMNESADALVMAAAGADFRPKNVAKDKLKKRDGIPQIELEVAPDILKTLASQSGEKKCFNVTVGFAAESRDLLANASEKLKSKGLDFIAANDISADDAGFVVETNRITLLFANGEKENLPLMSKSEAAEKIIEHIARLLK
jgi:phosphopantothenoylcysteine decarboxylase/phosphopantothenate--cysteine ligase